MKTEPLGPWTHGLFNNCDPTMVPRTGLVEAKNVDIDRSGYVYRRPGWSLLETGNAHSLVEHNERVYGVLDDTLGEFTESGFLPIAGVSGPVCWTVLDGDLVFADYSHVARLVDLTVLPLPGPPAEDEEDERVLAPLPGGSSLAYWQGRLLLARGTTLLYSEPMHYGVYDPLRNYVSLGRQIGWIAALSAGVFVGLDTGVFYLAGPNPKQWKLVRADAPPSMGGALVLSTDGMIQKLADSTPEVAVWLGRNGFVLGLPSGEVIAPQMERLEGLPLDGGQLVHLDGRIIAL